jgi:ATP-dependent helicase/nuclease subunit A
MGMDYIDAALRYSYATLTKNAFKIKKREELLASELRVLYVALTRAKEKLILTGAISDYEKKSESWKMLSETGGIGKNTLLNLPSFLEFIAPIACLGVHPEFKVSVFGDADLRLNSILPPDEVKSPTRPAQFEESLFYEYPHKELSGIPAKITVSQANKLDTDSYRLTFDEIDSAGEKYSGSDYGDYFHKLFELLDMERLKKGERARYLAREIIETGLMRETVFTDDIIEKIGNFFETPLSGELINADDFYREKPFLVRIPANMIFGGELKDEIMLQGATDCYFIKDGEITLIDFKTDKQTDGEKIRKNYARQIKLYSYALEKITGKKVTRKVIYTTHNNNLIYI